MELHQGKVKLSISKRFFTKRVIRHWNRLPQGSGNGIKVAEFKEHLDNTLRHWVCICVELGVGLVGLGIVCDSMTPHSLNAWRVSACFFSLSSTVRN